MAVYEYKCDNEHTYIETRGIKEDQIVTECPECGAELKRIWDTAAIIFNGPGFYKTGNPLG